MNVHSAQVVTVVYTRLENRTVVPAALRMEWLGRPPTLKRIRHDLESHGTSNKDNEHPYSPAGAYRRWNSVFSARNSKP